ncbi:uncharacterized protein BKA78DRAFT_80089 [Phyllosticta capitalensis]|uniref:uncharacterized protein n=1 Tax=Phyllosticta capitalensis TaxID=121624 RepID=UPI00312F7ADC
MTDRMCSALIGRLHVLFKCRPHASSLTVGLRSIREAPGPSAFYSPIKAVQHCRSSRSSRETNSGSVPSYPTSARRECGILRYLTWRGWSSGMIGQNACHGGRHHVGLMVFACRHPKKPRKRSPKTLQDKTITQKRCSDRGRNTRYKSCAMFIG